MSVLLAINLKTPSLQAQSSVPILLYHRLGDVRIDSMTVTTEHFKQQLDLLAKNHFSVIPLSEFIAWKLGKGLPPPRRSVVLTFDDGHESVYRDARPILLTRRLPATLFIYPSCISHASYAMTWGQLAELVGTGYFTIESHTFWHPNFKQESKKLYKGAYPAFVYKQLQQSKDVLERHVNRPITLLAWPFGIYDSYLLNRAAAAGYEAAFSIECRAATVSDPVMAIPRCIVSDDYVGGRFETFIEAAIRRANKSK